MKPTIIFLVICQLLFASVSLSAHSMDVGHDNHEGMHFHIEQNDSHTEQNDSHDSDHDNSSHIHFGLDLVFQSYSEPWDYSSLWYSLESQQWLSQSYRPPIPPPTV